MSKLGYFIGGVAAGIAGIAALACADDIKRAVMEWIEPRKDEIGDAEGYGGEDETACAGAADAPRADPAQEGAEEGGCEVTA